MIGNATKTLYNNLLNQLKAKTFELIDFVNHPDEVIQYLQSLESSIGNKKSYLSAIIYTLKQNNKPVSELYSTYMKELMAEHKMNTELQTLSEHQQKILVTWNELLEAQNVFAKSVNKNSKEDYLDLLILSLYTLNDPMRNDYANMKIVNKKVEANDANTNYLVWNKSTRTFIFNEYKTAKKMGQLQIPVSKSLQKVISHWLKLNDSEYLLGNAYSPQWLGNKIKSICKSLLNKSVTIQIIRHARVNELLKDNTFYNDKKDVATNMAHSTNIQEFYHVHS